MENNNKPIETTSTIPKIFYNREHDLYIEQLKKAINEKDVMNIGLSGPYGSGKSSIIKRLKSEYTEGEVIIISSLSQLKYTSDNTNNTVDSNDNLIDNNELLMADRIEQSILKQLIYKNSSLDYPQSNIKRIPSLSFYACFFVYVFSLLFSIVFKNSYLDYINNFINNNCTVLLTFIEMVSIALISFWVVMSFYIIKTLWYSLYKISIKKGNLEVTFQSNKLPFSINIYEIILFFIKNRKIKVLVFEDIDRFDHDVTILVMEELKELNRILNTSYGLKNRNIKFIYAFKDSLFKDNDNRNKYYDYIISVIPFSTLSTSYLLLSNMFKEEMPDNTLYNSLFNRLLEIISNHVIDYRTLINIRNDYCLYSCMLQVNDSNEKVDLLTSLLIKNTEYKLYEDIMNGIWPFDEILSEYNDLVTEEFTRIQSKKDEMSKIVDLCSSNNIIDFSFDNIIKIIKELSKNRIYKISGPYGTQNYNISDININNIDNIIFVDKNDLLYLLKQYKESILNGSFKKEYENIKNQLFHYSFHNVSMFIDVRKRVLSDLYDSNDKLPFKDNILIKDLILYNYLNDRIIDYLSLPINDERYSINDYKYLRRIKYGIQNNIEITNYDNVLSNVAMNIENYKNIRNYSILNYLLNSNNNININGKLVLNEIINECLQVDNNIIRFINGYKKNNCHYSFMKLLINKDDFLINLDKYVSNIDGYNNIFTTLLIDLLENYNLTEHKDLIMNIVDFINADKFFINFIDLSKENVLMNMVGLGVRFKNVESYNKYRKVIIENHLYEINNYNVNSLSLTTKNKFFRENILKNPADFYLNVYRDNKDFKIENKNVINELLKITNENNDIERIIEEFKNEIRIRELGFEYLD